MRILDLFCCAGGAAMGYHRAGFEVVGVDISPQPRYPFAFIQADVLSLDMRFLRSFDAIHASPPCQHHSVMTKRSGQAAVDSHPDLVAPVREMLKASGLPYIIENVQGAPLLDPVLLCGTMFPGLRVKRHRLFESSIHLTAPGGCPSKHPLHFTHDKRKPHYGQLDEMTAFVQVTGGGNCSKAAAADALGVDWMTKEEMNECIPPAYTEHLGRQLIAHIAATSAANQNTPPSPQENAA
ncbi:DNA cytosine methyltransferase [Brevundimonas sp. GCM10030266]|uniref:DNA cytosine methyltransferase n=1 Tax=Brevundimonas sp. GCM10030266 TaxID=3273386 RepID=UPI00360DB8CE